MTPYTNIRKFYAWAGFLALSLVIIFGIYSFFTLKNEIIIQNHTHTIIWCDKPVIDYSCDDCWYDEESRTWIEEKDSYSE